MASRESRFARFVSLGPARPQPNAGASVTSNEESLQSVDHSSSLVALTQARSLVSNAPSKQSQGNGRSSRRPPIINTCSPFFLLLYIYHNVNRIGSAASALSFRRTWGCTYQASRNPSPPQRVERAASTKLPRTLSAKTTTVSAHIALTWGRSSCSCLSGRVGEMERRSASPGRPLSSRLAEIKDQYKQASRPGSGRVSVRCVPPPGQAPAAWCRVEGRLTCAPFSPDQVDPNRRSGQRPIGYTCYLCGSQYGSHRCGACRLGCCAWPLLPCWPTLPPLTRSPPPRSLFIHIPQCEEKYVRVEEAKLPRERRPLPARPPRLVEAMEVRA